jgi:L-lactate dehydrogenase
VLVTAGVNEKTGGATNRKDPAGRLRLLDTNAGIYREIVPRVRRAAPDAIIVVVTDPPDPLADLVRKLGHERVVSTGTYLDSLRLRFHIARKLQVNPAHVEAQVLGEHGTSEVFAWSSARVGGVPLGSLLTDEARSGIESEVRYANITIIEGTGASALGIGVVCARIVEMIVRDERAVVPIGSWNPDYGVTLSVPSVVGRGGVTRRLPPDLSAMEQQALQKSADKLREAVSRLQL